MNAFPPRVALAAVLLFAAAGPLVATEASSLTIDCSTRSLPSQRQVGELLGMHNLGQVYAARARMMVDAARACQKPGTREVRIVMDDRAGPAAREERRQAGLGHPAR